MLTSNNAISIVMSAHNVEKYISEAIDSVLNQSFCDFEFIIIDDGSTDNTVQIILSYSDSRIVLLENQHDFIASLNLGMNRAKGKYIARMDADDRMFPDRLKIQYATMETHPEITVCGSWMQFFTSSSIENVSQFETGYIDFPLIRLLNGTIIANPTAIIRREFLIQNQIQYEYYPYAEDYQFWFQIAKSGGIFYTEPQTLLCYRLSESQVSRVYRREQQETSLKIKHEVLDFLIAWNKTAYPELSEIYKKLSELREKEVVNSEYIILFFSFLLKKIIYRNENKINNE